MDIDSQQRQKHDTTAITVVLSYHQAKFLIELLHEYCEGEQQIAPRKSFAYRIAQKLAKAKR